MVLLTRKYLLLVLLAVSSLPASLSVPAATSPEEEDSTVLSYTGVESPVLTEEEVDTRLLASAKRYMTLQENYNTLLKRVDGPLSASENALEDIVKYEERMAEEQLDPDAFSTENSRAEDWSPQQSERVAKLLISEIKNLLEHIKNGVVALAHGRRNWMRLRQLYGSSKRGPSNSFVRIGRSGDRAQQQDDDVTDRSARLQNALEQLHFMIRQHVIRDADNSEKFSLNADDEEDINDDEEIQSVSESSELYSSPREEPEHVNAQQEIQNGRKSHSNNSGRHASKSAQRQPSSVSAAHGKDAARSERPRGSYFTSNFVRIGKRSGGGNDLHAHDMKTASENDVVSEVNARNDFASASTSQGLGEAGSVLSRSKRYVRVGRLPLSAFLHRNSEENDATEDDSMRSPGYQLTKSAFFRSGK